MNADKLMEWIDTEIMKIKQHVEYGVHTEKMIYYGSLVQMETLKNLIESGAFD